MSLMSILFRLGTDNSQLDTGLAKARNQVNSFASGAARSLAGMFAGGAVLAGMKSLFNEMDNVQKIARRFGATTDEIQRIGHAAKLSGTDIEVAAKALVRLSVDANKAASQGLTTYEDRFQAIGISAQAFLSSNLEGKMKLLAGAHQQAGEDAQKQAALLELLGGRAAALIPMLDAGKEGLEAMFENAPVLAEETVNAMANANDQITTLIQNAKVLAGTIIGGVSDIAAAAGGGNDQVIDRKSFMGLAEQQIDQESPELGRIKRRAAIQARADRLAAEHRYKVQTESAEAAAAEELRIAEEHAVARAAAEEQALNQSRDSIAEAENKRIETARAAQQKLIYDQMSDAEKLAAKQVELSELENKSTVSGSERIANENAILQAKAEIAALQETLSAEELKTAADLLRAQADLADARYDALSDTDKLIEKEKQINQLLRERQTATGVDLLRIDTQILETKRETADITARIANEQSRAADAAEREAEAYRRSVDDRAGENLSRRGKTGQEIARERRAESDIARERRSVQRKDVRDAARAEGESKGLRGLQLERHVADAVRRTPGGDPDGVTPPPPGGQAGQAGRGAAAEASALASEATLQKIHTILDTRLPRETA